jgi:uncharacterized protein YdeI (BOF family)
MQLERKSIYRAIKTTGVSAAMATGLALSTAVSAADPNPYLKPDESWISMSGEVESVTRDSFVLDYGDGSVIVEMDDGDRDADGYKLINGDKVTVAGRIDDDFLETTSIEASSVYVENIGTTFWASARDEESDAFYEMGALYPLDDEQITVQGTISEVDDDEFVINSGTRAVRVELDDLGFNPLDDEGYLKLSRGDFVKVIGEMDDDLFEGRKLEADYVIKLYQ